MSDDTLIVDLRRPAKVGDHLSLVEFPSGVKGFTASVNLAGAALKSKRTWRRLGELLWFVKSKAPEPPCVVSVPDGTRLRITKLSSQFQDRYGVGFGGTLTFAHPSADQPEVGGNREIVNFPDESFSFLQDLPEGLEVCVISVPDGTQPEVQADLNYTIRGRPTFQKIEKNSGH